MKEHKLKVSVLDGRYEVNAIAIFSYKSKAIMVLGHGAGAGMQHPFMSRLAQNLDQQGISSLRYNFPYIEQGRRTPTSPAVAEATVRAAVDKALQIAPGQKLLVGGKSYGGRMSSQAQAKQPLTSVAGLVFFGYPLHAPGRPGDSRGAHLADIHIPMLFLQGSRDKLADLDMLTPLLHSLGKKAALEVIEGADHSFNLLKSADKTSEEAQAELAKLVSDWLDKCVITS